MVRVVLTDIEGTTSSIRFVKEVLFPYAAAALPQFLADHWQDAAVQQQVQALRAELGEPLADAAAVNALLQPWIEQDRKHTVLKALQGMIWDHGYRSGAYQAHMYEEVPAALRRWHDAGLPLYVYSSGSIAAQKLFFGFSTAGDLTGLFSGYFDTTSGGKREADSYRRITAAIGCEPGQILFLSDIVEELDAAAAAGLQTTLLDRDGLAPTCSHPVVTDFDRIALP